MLLVPIQQTIYMYQRTWQIVYKQIQDLIITLITCLSIFVWNKLFFNYLYFMHYVILLFGFFTLAAGKMSFWTWLLWVFKTLEPFGLCPSTFGFLKAAFSPNSFGLFTQLRLMFGRQMESVMHNDPPSKGPSWQNGLARSCLNKCLYQPFLLYSQSPNKSIVMHKSKYALSYAAQKILCTYLVSQQLVIYGIMKKAHTISVCYEKQFCQKLQSPLI